MCDTVVALGNTTKDGSILFAKNSDRQPNEPLLLIHEPKKTYPKHSTLRCTYIEIDQVEETHEIYMVKPSWMWGCEMGTNEHGLTIGNEAVFTKEKVNKVGLLGMDLVRLALERCTESEEAIHCITELLAKYGQGGNCGYEKPFTYHNSFLICDKTSAWILETAGNYWAAEKVKDIRAISNRLTIGENYDLAHPELISHAIEKGWHKKGEPFHFAKSYSDFLYTKLSGSFERASCAENILQTKKGEITADTMKEVLRSHHSEESIHIHAFSVKSICMHAGFIYGDQTTGSYIISLNENSPMVGWVTGSSATCISIFKPILFTENTNPFFREDDPSALHFWLIREKIHRLLMKAPEDIITNYNEERKEIEASINDLIHKNAIQTAWGLERGFVEKYLQLLEPYDNNPIKGNIYYKYYWNNQNKRLYNKHEKFFVNKTDVLV